jgi:hypothetical protein
VLRGRESCQGSLDGDNQTCAGGHAPLSPVLGSPLGGDLIPPASRSGAAGMREISRLDQGLSLLGGHHDYGGIRLLRAPNLVIPGSRVFVMLIAPLGFRWVVLYQVVVVFTRHLALLLSLSQTLQLPPQLLDLSVLLSDSHLSLLDLSVLLGDGVLPVSLHTR